MTEIDVSRSLSAERNRVFEIYTDHAGWTDWAGVGRVRLETPGQAETNGVGAVRKFVGGGREAVTVFERPARMEYRIVGGIPVRNHHGVVTFDSTADGGTRIRWRVRADPPLGTGWLVRVILTAVFERILHRLERRLETP